MNARTNDLCFVICWSCHCAWKKHRLDDEKNLAFNFMNELLKVENERYSTFLPLP
jgi:hypothetical protein